MYFLVPVDDRRKLIENVKPEKNILTSSKDWKYFKTSRKLYWSLMERFDQFSSKTLQKCQNIEIFQRNKDYLSY